MKTATALLMVMVLLAVVLCLPEVAALGRGQSVDNQLLLVQEELWDVPASGGQAKSTHGGLPRRAADKYVNAGEESVWSTGNAFSLFQAWGAKHHRVWKSSNEMEQRFRIFVDNLRYIETRRSQLQGRYRLGLNRFADLTHDEFKKAYLGGSYANDHVDCTAAASSTLVACRRRNTGAADGPFLYGNVSDIPKSIDWREKGAVGEIKDQGPYCGSSWAFSSVAAVESASQIETGKLVPLSEQELVDCDRKVNRGCHGGVVDYAFEFILQNGGLDSERDYPYTGGDGACDIVKMNSHVVSIDGYEDVPSSDEGALQKAVAHQPVSVAIDAGGRDLQLYDGGVFSGSCGKKLNLAVVVVGYGTEDDGTDYWIVRNSWGVGWGEQGYLKMQRMGGADRDGLCGINLEPSYPIKRRAPSPTPPPPSTPDEEVQCDEGSSCPAGSTCCCNLAFGDQCFGTWSCCPAVLATCCGNGDYCCPPEFPTCDLSSRSCLWASTSRVNGLHVREKVDPLRRFAATATRNSTLHSRLSSQ